MASDGIFTPCLLNELHRFVLFYISVKRSIRSAAFVTVPVTVRLKPISARHGTWSSGLYYVDTIEMRPGSAMLCCDAVCTQLDRVFFKVLTRQTFTV